MTALARRLATGVLAAALVVAWTMLIVTVDPHAQAICAAMPHLAVTLGAAFAAVAFVIGSDL